ncbi:MAG: peroxiredoxin [Burkholderiales bacterium]
MLATTSLEAGQHAPTFSLPDADMETVELAQFVGKQNIVLYFYQKDGGPGCTTEAIEFTDIESEFTKRNTVVLGVSPDDCLKHAEFRDEHGISITLLADVEREVCRRYGVMHEREVGGQIKECVHRATFVIDKSGVLRHALYGVNPRGHAREVLELVRQL